jgi:hypothetical protein
MPRSLGCARCGSCCDPVYLSEEMATVMEAWRSLKGVPDPATDEGWAHWAKHGWADDRRDTAIAKYQPDAPDQVTARFAAEHWHRREDSEEGRRVYDCDQFDHETRLCLAGDGRPPVCSGYPWYQAGPTAERADGLYGHCSYLLDVPPADRPEGARPLIPIEVIKQ